MSTLKSELKQLVTHEVGVKVDDALEAAKRDLATLEGRQSAFADGAKACEALLSAVDGDISEGKFDLEMGAHVKRYVTRCSNALTNMVANTANLRIAQTGKVQGFQHTIAMLKNMLEAEQAKVAAAQAAESAPPPENPRARETGVHPAPTIKALRLAEEAAPKKKGRKQRGSNT